MRESPGVPDVSLFEGTFWGHFGGDVRIVIVGHAWRTALWGVSGT